MAGFVDVVLRGLILVLTSVTLAVVGAGAAIAQAAVLLVGLGAVADAHGTWPLAAFFETTFALTATARVILAAAVAALAFTLARRAAPRLAWTALTVTATLLVASSAVVSHAVARVEWRAPLIALDAAHQVAAALWIGGLAHLVLLGVAGHASPPFDVGGVVRRFSTLAFRSMAAIVLAGLALTLAYVGDLEGGGIADVREREREPGEDDGGHGTEGQRRKAPDDAADVERRARVAGDAEQHQVCEAADPQRRRHLVRGVERDEGRAPLDAGDRVADDGGRGDEQRRRHRQRRPGEPRRRAARQRIGRASCRGRV